HLPRRLWWTLTGLTLAWGFNWTAIKVALSGVAPLTFRTLCLAVGSAVLFGVVRAGGQSLAVPKGQWSRLALLAFFNVTCWNALVVFGMTMIPSGRAAILAFTMPAWAIPLSVWLLGERMNGRKLTGLALGMAGMALLIGEGAAGLRAAPLGSLLVLSAALSWALGTVLQRRYPVAMPPAPYTAWMMLLGGIPIFAGALLLEDPGQLASVGLWPALGVLYNILIAFSFAQWAWIRIATTVPVAVSSLSMLMITVLGVFSGMVFLGERQSWAEYAAIALVFGSLLTVVIPRRACGG
ncbi:MAG: DMT family transporter, partial [Burkholderiales bacterium]